MQGTKPFRGFLTTTLLAAASTTASAAYINATGASDVRSDANVDGTSAPFAAPDDINVVTFFDQVDSEVSSVFSSASSYAGQSVLAPNADTLNGAGSVLGDAIAFFPEGSGAESFSDFTFVFDVDTPTKVELDWSLRANGVGDDTEFMLGWLLTENASEMGSVLIDNTDAPATWDQFSGTPESFQLTPGNTYTFSIGAAGHTEAGADALSNDFYGSFGAQWQFTLTIPSPSTLALAAPVGALFTARRRRA